MKPLASEIQPNPDELMTAYEVASLLKCSARHVYRLADNRALPPSHKIFDGPRGFRWTRSEVETYLRDRAVRLDSRRTLKPFHPSLIR